MSHGNEMICQPVTLSGDAEWPKVADAVIEASKSGLIVIPGQHEFQDHRAISDGTQRRQIASFAERSVTLLHPAKRIRGVVDEHRTMEPIIRYALLIGLATIAIRGDELGNPGASIAHACVMRPPEVDVALCLQELVKTGLILVKSKGHRTGQGHVTAVCGNSVRPCGLRHWAWPSHLQKYDAQHHATHDIRTHNTISHEYLRDPLGGARGFTARVASG
jgi:hypothetical protein